jgi:LDH2 family malate/lactate/ureidoglycolate dehydrogenase
MASSASTFARVARDSGPLWACTLAFDRVVPLGAVRLWRPLLIAEAVLARQVEAILEAWGLSDEHISITVEKMLYADLRGIDGHGCSKLRFYHELLADGRLNPSPAIEVARTSEATVVVDGDGGLGHVPATVAMEEAIDRCQATGVGVAAVRNSGHYGAAGAYAVMAADRGLIGVATTSTPTPALVPTFGRDPLLGTNPIAVAAPAVRNRHFLLDMATSTVSLGKLVQRWRSGRPIPRGWALNGRGRAVTNGRVAARHRRLAPLGGQPETASYKGYGLALVVEILSSILPGLEAATPSAGRRPVGHFLLALDPARFRPEGSLSADLDDLLDSMHRAAPANPNRPVLVPGDPEELIRAKRGAQGIPLPKSVVEDIRAVAIASRAPFLLGSVRR